MSVNLFQVDHKELNDIWRDIEESDGVITPEQEKRITELMAEQLGLVANAAKVAQLEANVAQLKQWVAEAQARYRRWEQTAGTIRAAMLAPLKGLLPEAHMPKGQKSILGQRGALRIGLRQNHDGKLDTNDPALDKEKTIKGFTEEQVKECQIDKRYFEARTVYVLKRDVLADEVRIVESTKGMKRPKRLGLARLDKDPTVVLTVLGGSTGGKRSRSGALAEGEEG